MDGLLSQQAVCLEHRFAVQQDCGHRAFDLYPRRVLTASDHPYRQLRSSSESSRRFNGETADLNTAISRLEREIELLREYRTRLVADVVTGKLDVREAAARLPEEAGEVGLSDLSDESDLPDVSDGAGEPLPEDEP